MSGPSTVPAGYGSAPRGRRGYLRGSGVLFGGRLIAILLNFVVQVLLVRALSKGDYGAFGFALSVVTVAANVNLLGLTPAVGRFAPIHEEAGNSAGVAGTVLAAVAAVGGLGAAIVALTLAFGGAIGGQAGTDPLSLELVLLMIIALAPVQALDGLGQTLAAAFIGARAIFFRRYLLGPLLRLLVVGSALLFGGSVRHIAIGYVVAGVIGVLAYGWMLMGLWHRHAFGEHLRAGAARRSAGPLLRFALPLLTTDLALVLRINLAVIVLEAVRGPEEVASLRAVVPVAGLLLVVFQSFKMMFLPVASRMLARKESAEIADLYWKTVCWLAVLAFPALAVFLFLPRPIIVFLFTERYASSAVLLSVLAAGQFPHAVFGLGSQLLQVFARVKNIVLNNVIAVGVMLAANLLLAPRHGATGSAWAIAIGIAAHVGLNQVVAASALGGPLIRREALVVLLEIGLLLAALAGIQTLGPMPLLVVILLILVATLALLRANRRVLDVARTFPELARIPLLGRLLGWLTGRPAGEGP